MPGSPVLLFLNPAAGRGRAAQRLATINNCFDAHGIPITAVHSTARGDLEARITAAVDAGARKLVVAGGDGSIHEAVNGVLAASGRAALGIIPCGTGNDFAKACGIPLDWQQASHELAARIAARTPARKVDAGRMNERYFANGVGIGFDAKVTRIARGYRWPRGDSVYLLALLRCLYDGVATPALSIRADDELFWQDPATLASVCNGAWVGGMFHIAPMARNADAKLDLLIAAPVSRRRILSLLPKLIRGQHVTETEIRHRPVSTVTITSDSEVESHLDGELQPLQKRFEISVCEAALDLI